MLTEKKIEALKPGESEKKIPMGVEGLSLLIAPTGGKLWRFRYRFDGKDQLISLGRWPEISGEEALRRHLEARKQVAHGINPSAQRKAEKDAVRHDLKSVCEAWLTKFYPHQSKNKARIVSRLTNYIYPTLGGRPMKSITTAEVLKCLEVIADSGRKDTAFRCMGELSRIWKWAVGRDLAAKNIIEGLEGQLPDPERRKLPGLTDPVKVGKLLRDIDGYRGQPETRMCLQLMPYLAQRPTELRESVWEEFDLKGALWRIPAKRMKMDKTKRPDHLVPLPTQVVALLRKLQVLSGSTGLLFPGKQRRNEYERNRPISDGTVNKALRKMGYDTFNEHCGHGFRTTFSTLAREEGENFWSKEAQLSHAVPGVAGKYDEATEIKARRPMMQRWANYLDKLRTLPEDSHGRSATQAAMKSSMSDSSQRIA